MLYIECGEGIATIHYATLPFPWPKDFQSKVDTLYSINDDTFLLTPISIVGSYTIKEHSST
jgi:hypothetical protein